jgi:hypothetical protein
VKDKIIGFCGIACSDCRAFIATERDDARLKKEVAEAWSTKEEVLEAEDISCDGCLATGRKFGGTCEVRRCGYDRGVENCAYCREFPCGRLTMFWENCGGTEPKDALEAIRKKLGA